MKICWDTYGLADPVTANKDPALVSSATGTPEIYDELIRLGTPSADAPESARIEELI